MLQALQVLAVVLVSVAMALSLAHALEFPGKLRLARASYFAVQPIYYPGFTIGGFVGEFGGMVATLVVLAALLFGTPSFWLVLAAFLALLAAHGVYWVLTHPVNRVWLRGERLGGAGAGCFGIEPRPCSRLVGAGSARRAGPSCPTAGSIRT